MKSLYIFFLLVTLISCSHDSVDDDPGFELDTDPNQSSLDYEVDNSSNTKESSEFSKCYKGASFYTFIPAGIREAYAQAIQVECLRRNYKVKKNYLCSWVRNDDGSFSAPPVSCKEKTHYWFGIASYDYRDDSGKVYIKHNDVEYEASINVFQIDGHIVIENQTSNGGTITQKIQFDSSLQDATQLELNPEIARSFHTLNQNGYINSML